MEFTNTFTIPVGVDHAFTTLTDLETVAPCMPGAKLETVDGDTYTGRVKVKVGPMSLTYKGTAELVERDDDAHTARIEARGSEARGGGTASADVTAALTEVPDGTEVVVTTRLDITGKPAQFGRGVMGDVGRKIIDTFADCLARTFDEPDDVDEAGEGAGGDPGADDGGSAAAAGDGPGADDTTDPDAATAASADRPVPVDPQAPGAATAAQVSAAAGTTAPATAAVSSGPRQVADTEPEVEALDLMDVAGGSVARRAVPAIGVIGLVALLVWLFTRRRD